MKKLKYLFLIVYPWLASCGFFYEEAYDGYANEHDACRAYFYGQPGEENKYDEAVKWCTISSYNDNVNSQVMLAELYLKGNGVPQDPWMAADLYQKAASNGDKHAQFMLYMLYNVYLKDESTEEQKAMGLVALNASVSQGYELAINAYKAREVEKYHQVFDARP